ncbi:MAG: 30S ribosomal protein S24e [Thermoplasmata archaeon]|nr:30S ribosomal protein S24e [Thermoplasmata archaeon]
MDVEIVGRKDNLLLERSEVDFLVKHENESTPPRKQVREALGIALNVGKSILIVDSFTSEFGKGTSKGTARVYKDLEKAKKIEDDHILVRNGLMEKKKK